MTPTLSDAEFLAGLSLVGGRLSVALKEMQRRLKEELPARIAAVNTGLGLTGNNAYQAPKEYLIAPIPIKNKHINNLIIDYSTRLVEFGARAYRKETTLKIFIPDKRIEAESQITDALDRSEILLRILQQYQGGCTDPQGRKAWDGLSLSMQNVLPEAWKEYSGICIQCELKQTPTPNIWSVK